MPNHTVDTTKFRNTKKKSQDREIKIKAEVLPKTILEISGRIFIKNKAWRFSRYMVKITIVKPVWQTLSLGQGCTKAS